MDIEDLQRRAKRAIQEMTNTIQIMTDLDAIQGKDAEDFPWIRTRTFHDDMQVILELRDEFHNHVVPDLMKGSLPKPED